MNEDADREASPLVGRAAPPALHLMSWNIRRRVPSPHWRKADRWSHRAPSVATLLRAESPTILGVQEALAGQAQFVAHSLGDRYRSIGVGRSRSGRGEGCPLFYDADRLELVSWEQLALSDRPHKPGSASWMSWGNIFPRIMVTALFRDRDTAASLSVINTHFDHLSKRSRVRSARMVRQHALSQRHAAVVMGDLNARPHSTEVREMLGNGELVDTWTAAHTQLSEEWTTYANYRPPRREGERIDMIAATRGITVRRAAINPRQYSGAWGSDHLPVHAMVDATQQERIE
ncbi:endonuclease/exonuclease/phosphatase family protein [Microbacterium sp. NPDC076911]|uniref:endonuclease/exonuclease/phosphatase family protein n=1 Tax=Microbacterium sp. NPDC076911 TaxID=3154958 RepID=UPI0034466F5B